MEAMATQLMSFLTYVIKNPFVIIAILLGFFIIKWAWETASAYIGAGPNGLITLILSLFTTIGLIVIFVFVYPWLLRTVGISMFRSASVQANIAAQEIQEIKPFGTSGEKNPIQFFDDTGAEITTTPAAEQLGKYIISKGAILRDAPSGKGKEISRLQAGETVNVLEFNSGDGYCEAGKCRRAKIQTSGGKEGWIHEACLGDFLESP